MYTQQLVVLTTTTFMRILLGGSFTAATNYTVNIQNSSDCVVQLDEGDIYFRLRQLRYGYNQRRSTI
jgi:hypothetical protein